jgi:mediator of RNA polymerase II transcription subunit 5
MALTSVLQQSDLVERCDHVSSRGPDAMQEDHERYCPERSVAKTLTFVSLRSFSRDLLQQLLANGLIDQAFAISVDPLIANDSTPRLQTEALDVGHDLAVRIFSSPAIYITD